LITNIIYVELGLKRKKLLLRGVANNFLFKHFGYSSSFLDEIGVE